jgi:hypothetical protein
MEQILAAVRDIARALMAAAHRHPLDAHNPLKREKPRMSVLVATAMPTEAEYFAASLQPCGSPAFIIRYIWRVYARPFEAIINLFLLVHRYSA